MQMAGVAALTWTCTPRLCSVRAAEVLDPRDVFLPARGCGRLPSPRVGAGNRGVLPISLPFSTFVTFLCLVFFNLKEKINNKKRIKQTKTMK